MNKTKMILVCILFVLSVDGNATNKAKQIKSGAKAEVSADKVAGVEALATSEDEDLVPLEDDKELKLLERPKFPKFVDPQEKERIERAWIEKVRQIKQKKAARKKARLARARKKRASLKTANMQKTNNVKTKKAIGKNINPSTKGTKQTVKKVSQSTDKRSIWQRWKSKAIKNYRAIKKQIVIKYNQFVKTYL